LRRRNSQKRGPPPYAPYGLRRRNSVSTTTLGAILLPTAYSDRQRGLASALSHRAFLASVNCHGRGGPVACQWTHRVVPNCPVRCSRVGIPDFGAG
jgi:hypothetical protein